MAVVLSLYFLKTHSLSRYTFLKVLPYLSISLFVFFIREIIAGAI